VKQLPSLNSETYWGLVKQRARELKSDGCSCVPDFYVEACYEHDVHYRTHETVYGEPISKAEADATLRSRIVSMATKNLSWNPKTWGNLTGYPMSLWRWAGVRLFGTHSWEGEDTGSPIVPLATPVAPLPES
jgi:hypothetical protein